jgi:hypothetical protein
MVADLQEKNIAAFTSEYDSYAVSDRESKEL